ncbi:MAG: formate--tetrahydrofolate ligase [Clostridiales bacterium]|jgi:formate--tetrahydrofolate ligase|nr:formate--tetrahydrofolate ligase [Clostridiales bacterium]
MLSDIEIAQQARPEHIERIAAKLGLTAQDIECYGKYKAKIPLEVLDRIPANPDAKLVLVTAMNPTPAGEGKTTVSVGLAQALTKLGKKAVLALREPSLGPVFGVKGGACGGGYSQVIPMEDINLHFTGDIHAITTANNLLAAMIDNHLYQGNELNIDPDRVYWKRCLDMNDRTLRDVTIASKGGKSGVTREDHFTITAASEVMATFCMAKDLEDLRRRLAGLIIACDKSGKNITAGDLGADGAMTAVLRDALCPNLVQSLEGVPALVHGGPFANISHGCNTIIATKAAMKLGEITVTEAGFGADLGAEKFLDIKCREAGLCPDACVIVSTVRSLKYNAGISKADLSKPDPEAVRRGFVNLAKHIENINSYGIPAVVAANRFLTDTDEEFAVMIEECNKLGAACVPTEIFAKGGEGGIDLAQSVLEAVTRSTGKLNYAYELNETVEEKIVNIATKIYGAAKVDILPEAQEKIDKFTADGYGGLPVCLAKTQYSLSDDPKALGRPEGFTLTVRDCHLSAGAGYIVGLTGTILTMPGLPPHPAALDIGVSDSGDITGLF